MRRSSLGEVRADALAQVGGLADVQHLAPAVDEQVDAGRAGKRRGEAQLGHLRVAAEAREGRAGRRGRARRRLAARSSSTWSRSVVARASSRARWVGRWSSRSRLASVPSRQLGTSSRTQPAGERARVDDRVAQAAASRRGRGRRSGTTRRSGRCGRRARSRRRTRRRRAAPPRSAAPGATIAWVMPGEHGDLGRDGRARVHEGLEGAEAARRRAPSRRRSR